jgi:hypothetical protein
MRLLFLLACFWCFCPANLTAQIINVEDRRMKHADTIAVHGSGDIGFNLFKNDKSLITTRTALQMEYQHFRHILMLFAGHSLIHTEGVANVQNEAFTHLRYNYRLPRLWTYELYSQVQYNERTFVKRRFLFGSGARLRLHQGKSNRFYLGASLMFEQVLFRETNFQNNDGRLSSYFAYYLKLGDNLSLSQTTYFQPLLTRWHNNRLSTEGVLLFNVSKHLRLQCRANLSYDNDPRLPEKIPNLVYAWTNGLRYEF